MNNASRKIVSQTQFLESKPFDNISYGKNTKNNIKYNANPTKPEQMSYQYFTTILNRNESTNASIVQVFKILDYNARIKLEIYCLENFENLPLFLLYELSWQLGLQNLRSASIQQFINENYEQLNYSKYGLIKCSYFTFRKILDEYDSLVKSLEIQGLKQTDLKSVIDDYCLMCNVDDNQKGNLYNQFVYAKQIFIINPQSQVRRSMIQPPTTRIQNSTPLRQKNTILMCKTPNLMSSGLVQKQKKIQGIKKKGPKIQSTSLSLNESANRVKIQIQQLNKKSAKLYCDLLETNKMCIGNKNEKFFRQSFEKLERNIKKMQKQLKMQNQKIQVLQKGASDMKLTTTNAKKIDFVFKF